MWTQLAVEVSKLLLQIGILQLVLSRLLKIFSTFCQQVTINYQHILQKVFSKSSLRTLTTQTHHVSIQYYSFIISTDWGVSIEKLHGDQCWHSKLLVTKLQKKCYNFFGKQNDHSLHVSKYEECVASNLLSHSTGRG